MFLYYMPPTLRQYSARIFSILLQHFSPSPGLTFKRKPPILGENMEPTENRIDEVIQDFSRYIIIRLNGFNLNKLGLGHEDLYQEIIIKICQSLETISADICIFLKRQDELFVLRTASPFFIAPSPNFQRSYIDNISRRACDRAEKDYPSEFGYRPQSGR